MVMVVVRVLYCGWVRRVRRARVGCLVGVFMVIIVCVVLCLSYGYLYWIVFEIFYYYVF